MALNIDKLTEQLRQFRDQRGWADKHNPRDLSIALTVEAAELLELFQWGEDPDESRIGEELSDVIIYALQLADCVGLDMGLEIEHKMRMNARKYPAPDDEIPEWWSFIRPKD